MAQSWRDKNKGARIGAPLILHLRRERLLLLGDLGFCPVSFGNLITKPMMCLTLLLLAKTMRIV